MGRVLGDNIKHGCPAGGVISGRKDKKMKNKTFYSVNFVIMGAGESTAWFDSKEKALCFHEQTKYSDAPICHKFRNPSVIDEHLLLVAQTREMMRVKC